MNKKFVLLAFASVFLLSAVIGSQLIVAVAAQPRTVGVSEGDWADYDVTCSGNGTVPWIEDVADWGKVTVQEISGTNIIFEVRARYPNATERTDTYVVDVDTGLGNGSGYFIAANLNAGNLIYTSPDPWEMFYGATINETISRIYLGESVMVNHWNTTSSQTVPGEMNQTTSTNYYWYRATGMWAEMSMYYLFQPLEGNTTWWEMKVVIIDVIPEFPPALILPLFIIATLAAVWLGKTIWSTKKLTRKPSPYA